MARLAAALLASASSSLVIRMWTQSSSSPPTTPTTSSPTTTTSIHTTQPSTTSIMPFTWTHGCTTLSTFLPSSQCLSRQLLPQRNLTMPSNYGQCKYNTKLVEEKPFHFFLEIKNAIKPKKKEQ
eukprot:5943287-Amphidinium_carterae.1